MNPTQDSIVEKIKKLHALAEGAGTEHEAALAMQRISELCKQHNLDIGVVNLAQQETEATEADYTHESSLWQVHWAQLSNAVDMMFGVRHYRANKNVPVLKNGYVVDNKKCIRIVFYGLKSTVLAAQMTYEYLLASVEAMLEGELRLARYHYSRGDRRSFRMGCARRIFEEAQKIKQAKKDYIACTEEQGLIHLENSLIRQHHAKMNLTRLPSYAKGASNYSAYSAGYTAGGRVNLHGANGKMLR